MIGETDTALTNSSATKFEVTEEQGFNLTNVKDANECGNSGALQSLSVTSCD